MLKELSGFIAESKIISRLTASGVVFGGLFLINQYISSDSIQPEILAIGSALFGSASTFLFLSEKS